MSQAMTKAKITDMTTGSLILVHFVEQQLEGWSFPREHWPLHITLVPWFSVVDAEAVLRSLARVADETTPFRLRVGGQEQFGVHGEVSVNIIANQELVKALHVKLVETLAEADTAYHEQRYMGQRFLAHITRHAIDGRHSSEGEEIQVNDFHLVRLVNEQTCRVEQQFDFIKA
jgi:2'-5' RNA ligase